MSSTCVLVIERENAKPIVIASESFYQLSKFKDKLDQKLSRTSIKSTSIIGLMDLDDFMSIEEILKESPQEQLALAPGIQP